MTIFTASEPGALPAPLLGVPIACLLSDCDGVIVDSEALADAIMLEVLQQAFDVADLVPYLAGLFGRRVIDIIQIMESRLAHPLDSVRRGDLQRVIDARVAEAAPPMPGMLEAYRALNLPIAVVSNSASDRLQRSVDRAGLRELVGSHVYAAEDVGRPKPAPDAYLHAARQMGYPPAACLVIEDSPTGVRAARAAGMRVLGFLGGSHNGNHSAAQLEAASAHGLFSRMSELPVLIARMRLGVDERNAPDPAVAQ